MASPMHTEHSSGSYSFFIEPFTADTPPAPELRRQHNDKELQCAEAVEAECRRLEAECRCLEAECRSLEAECRLQDEVQRIQADGQNVSILSQQNAIFTRALKEAIGSSLANTVALVAILKKATMTNPRRLPAAEELPRPRPRLARCVTSDWPQPGWSQERGRELEYDGQPQQTDQGDSPESSKPKKRKRKAGDAITATKGSRTPQSPHPNKVQKAMEAPCPFHPKGTHAAKDCFTLKEWFKEGRPPTGPQ